MNDYIDEEYAKAIGSPHQLPASRIYLRPTNAYLKEIKMINRVAIYRNRKNHEKINRRLSPGNQVMKVNLAEK